LGPPFLNDLGHKSFYLARNITWYLGGRDVKGIFQPNISGKERLLRALIAVALIAVAIFATGLSDLARIGVAGAAAFVAFEALRGWCFLRACGVRTRF